MYPVRSNFNSADNDSAWWIDNLDGVFTLYETRGSHFATAVQQRLKSSVAGTPPTWDGTITPSREIVVDGKWGPKTLRAIWAALPEDTRTSLERDPASGSRTIQDDARDGKVSRVSIAAALWVLYALGTKHVHLQSGQLYLDPDLIPLPYRAAAPPPPRGTTEYGIKKTGMTGAAPPESSEIGIVPYSSEPGTAEDEFLADEITRGAPIPVIDAPVAPTPSPAAPARTTGLPTLTTVRSPTPRTTSRATTAPTRTVPAATPNPTGSPAPAPAPARVTPTTGLATQGKPAETNYIPYVVGGTLALALGVVGYLIYKRGKAPAGQPTKAKV